MVACPDAVGAVEVSHDFPPLRSDSAHPLALVVPEAQLPALLGGRKIYLIEWYALAVEKHLSPQSAIVAYCLVERDSILPLLGSFIAHLPPFKG